MYFHINLAFICVILPFLISLTVLEYLNNYEASKPTRGTTIRSQPIGRDLVLYVRLYTFSWKIISHIFSKQPEYWIYIFSPSIIFRNNYWLIPSRIKILINKFILILYNEYPKSMYTNLISNMYLFLNLIIYIIIITIFRLFPYIFSTTRHLLFILSISLLLWIGFFIYLLLYYPIKFFTHLVPINSSNLLIHFIVIIELIMLLIPPLTLSIRLSSNLILGHLILILLINFIINCLIIFPLSILINNILLILEISISFIQVYVIIFLLTLYFQESN